MCDLLTPPQNTLNLCEDTLKAEKKPKKNKKKKKRSYYISDVKMHI